MAISNIKATIHNNIESVWDAVTDIEKYDTWRSDLSKGEILSEKQFAEYTKDGYVTNFTITLTDTYKRWEFDMENSNMTGHWTGVFIQKGEDTEIDFTEEVFVKKILMKPFVGVYLKKQQSTYIKDLKKLLEA